MKRKFVLSIVGFLFLLNVFVWQEVFVLNSPKYLEVDFLDVGQGDSVFIETPEGHQILIDGGPGSAVLQKLSERMPFWDKSLDLIILTHPEADHMQGILGILKAYKVDYFVWTGVIKKDAENKELAVLLDKAKNPNKNFLASIAGKAEAAKVIAVKAGEKIKAGNVEIDILFPLENLAGKELKNTSNDAGVVSKLIYGKNSFLFTGDISSTAEKALSNSYELDNLNSDVLKVAHHGSKYSTSDLFLRFVKPKYAVIEVGKNSYGHPTSEVLQRLQNYDIKVLRTDTQGDINMVSDGKNIKIK